MAYIIATYNLSPPVDEHGKPVPPVAKFVPGFVTYVSFYIGIRETEPYWTEQAPTALRVHH
jgi:hypothetical protein